MTSGDLDLRRQAMFTTMMQNNVNEWQEDAGDASLSDQEKYIKRIIQLWKGEPEDLFKINRWSKWIKHVAGEKREPEKFIDRSVLIDFAQNLLDMICDDRQPYLNQLYMKLDNDQWTRLRQLKIVHEENECARIAAEARGEIFSCSPENNEDVNVDDDDDDVQCLWKKAPERNNLNTFKEDMAVTPKCIKEETCSPDRLFQDLNNLSAKPEVEKRDLQQPSRMSEVSRKIKRRSAPIRPTASVTGIERKKPRACIETSNFPQLGIKITPKKPKLAAAAPTCQDVRYSCPISPKNLTEEFLYNIVDDNTESHDNSFFENSVQYLNYEDEVIENPTPPCSPVCTAVIEQNEISAGTSFNENLENKTTDENAVVSNKSFQKKDTSSISKIQRLKVGESTPIYSSNRKIKITGIRSYSQTSHPEPQASILSGKVNKDEEFLESSILEPPIDQDKENYPVSADEIAVKYPKPPSAPCLTLEMFDELKRTLERPPKDRIVSGFSLNILQEDLALLNQETEWLIDLNIDFYLELIKERSTRPGYPSVYIFHSFFYTLLTDKDGGYSAVEEATGEDDIFKYDLVFFSVNLSQHWRLVVVQFPFKTLRCYDSMPHNNAEVLRHIGQYLRQEFRRKKKNGTYQLSSSEDDSSNPAPDGDLAEPKSTRMFFDPSSWNVENVASESIPQQKNAIDCGIFVLQYAEYLSRQQDFDFDQTHIPYFRKRMMYETLTKTLLTNITVSENIAKSS